MASSKQYTLGGGERLKSRKLIDQIFKEGKAFSVFPFRVLYVFRKEGDEPLQAGFSASSRNFKRAVDRNRIKRVTRESYRTQKPALLSALSVNNQKLAVFLIYTAKELPEHAIVTEKMAQIIKRLISVIHEQGLTNT